MVVTEKCEKCVHEKICSFKGEYTAACEAVGNCSYPLREYGNDGRHSFKELKISEIIVKIRCPHMLTQSEVNRGDQVLRRRED